MRTQLLPILVCILFVSAASAQKPGGFEASKPGQTFYAEGGGPGILTLNYDRRLQPGEGGLGIRAGIGGIGFLKKGIFAAPVGLNYLMGSGNHYAELGAGGCYISQSSGNIYFDNTSSSFMVAYANFGYRYLPTNNGLSFRVFLCPLITPAGTIPFYAGGSVGIKF